MSSAKKKTSSGWGGARPGAGRKPNPNRAFPYIPHRARPRFDFKKPIAVTLHTQKGVSLKQARISKLLAETLKERTDETFAVVRSSVEANRVELVVRTKNAAELRWHVQSLMISFARRVNALLGRSGKLWADRYRATQ